jgi:hypothetical protein
MSKYYVQSGDLKQIVVCKEPFESCLKSLHMTFHKDILISTNFVVSERGFVLDRQPLEILSDEEIYSSEDVMGDYVKWVIELEKKNNG